MEFETKVIETTCPQFPGFYHTIFSPELEGHLENESQEMGVEILYDYLDWNNDKYQKEVAEHYSGEMETVLVNEGYITSMKFQKLWSPREYNFYTDLIYVAIGITAENHAKIVEWVKENRESFDSAIKEKFTSHDGFMSKHSNDGDEWFEMLINDEFDDDDVQYTFIFETIIKEDELKDDDSIQDGWQGNNCLGNYYTIDDNATPTEVKKAIEAYYEQR
jgi:hypothetical protein